MDLFETTSTPEPPSKNAPLAERVRPQNLDEVVGQDQLVGKDAPLRKAVESQDLQSFVLWGPPGTGKTTIARIVASQSGAHFVPFSAVLCGIKEVREVMKDAERKRLQLKARTIVFVDEIHRFNKAQQDAFLPFVEKGDITLIGATTENPSFEINGALLSRLRVYVLDPLAETDQVRLLKRVMETDEQILRKQLSVSDEVLSYLVTRTPGDARAAINLFEAATYLARKGGAIEQKHIDQAAQRVMLLYDKGGEEHFNIISALHKSMRNGDANAALYWLARMLESGEDPLYVARRMIRFASEDVGNADPHALMLATSVKETVHFIGLPEGKLALAQLAIYLSAAPKSNSVYQAYKRVEKDLKAGKVYPVPLEIRNAPTKLMKGLDYGKGYEYSHHTDEKTTALDCLPKELKGREYYKPVEEGIEKKLAERLRYWEAVRRNLRSQ